MHTQHRLQGTTTHIMTAVLALTLLASLLIWQNSLASTAEVGNLSSPVHVSITEEGFDPAVIMIIPGTEVIWTNNTTQQLTLVSGNIYRLFLPAILSNSAATASTGLIAAMADLIPASQNDWGATLLPGQSYSHVFTEPGEFPYHLRNFHFAGAVVVMGDDPPTSTPTITLTPTATEDPSLTPTGTATTTPTSTPTGTTTASPTSTTTPTPTSTATASPTPSLTPTPTSTPLIGPDLAISKYDNDIIVTAGGLITYTITFTNTGSFIASGVILTETLPANTSFNAENSSPGWGQGSSAGSYLYTVGDLDVNVSQVITFVVTADTPLPPGTQFIHNSVQIGDDGQNGLDPNPDNNSATTSTPVTTGPTNVCGTISQNTTWSRLASPYLVTCDVIVSSGVTLTIESGAEVRFNSTREISVYGTLFAAGTPTQNIELTANTTTPTRGYWDGIYVRNGGAAILDYVHVQYGGYSGGSIDANIRVNDGGFLSLTNSTISHSDRYGVYIDGVEAPTITGNTITDNNSTAIYIVDDSDNTPTAPIIQNNILSNSTYPIYITGQYFTGERTIRNNSGSGNTYAAIYLGLPFYGTTTLNADAGFVWRLSSAVYIPAGQSLILDPNVVLKINNQLTVYGTLTADTTAGNEIIFTSWKDDAAYGDSNNDGNATTPAKGDWYGIYISNGGSATFDYAIIRYGGYSSAYPDANIRVNDGGFLSLTNSTVSHSDRYGVYVSSANHLIRNNNIINSVSYGVYNGNTANILVRAEYNWWGNNSGPAPYGTGNGINYRTCSDGDGGTYICQYYVDANPWLGKQEQEARGLLDSSLPDDPIRNTDPAEAGVPYIQSVASAYGQVFMGNVNLDNPISVAVDWNGADPDQGEPGVVRFQVSGQTTEVEGNAFGAQHIYNVGADLPPGTAEIEVVAVNAEGVFSKPFVLRIMKVVLPPWLEELGVSAEGDGYNISLTQKPDYLEFYLMFTVPPEKFKADLTVPGWFPYFGGQEIGASAQAKTEMKLRSDATGSLLIYGEAAFKAADQEIGGSVEGYGAARLTPHGRIEMTEASLDFSIYGTMQAEMPILEFIPQLAVLSNTPPASWAVKPILETLKIYASITPELAFASTWGPRADNQSWEWKGGSGSTTLSTELGLKLEVFDEVEAKVHGNGSGTVNFVVPNGASPYVESVVLDIWGGAEFTIGDWTILDEESEHLTVTLPDGTTQSLVLSAPMPTISSPAVVGTVRDRAYPDGPQAVFVGGQSYGPLTAEGAASSMAVGVTPIMLNVYSDVEPALAVHPVLADTAVMVWVHDDINLPVVRSKEIFASHWNGTTWSLPVNVTNNTRADYNPQIAFDGFGNAVAVWVQLNDPALPIDATFDVTITKKFEIAYSVYHVASDTWGPVQTLTNDNVYDHHPLLSTGQDGQIMLAWVANDNGYLFSDADHPNALYSSIWDGASWSTPVLITNTMSYMLRSGMAYHNSSEAVLVLGRDMDEDWTTQHDADLLYTSWNGTAWSPFTRILTDTVRDERPLPLYTSSGEKRLLWYRDGQIYMMGDDWTQPPTATSITGGTTGLQDYRVALDHANNLSLIWQATSDELADISYAIYDDFAKQWSLIAQLTQDQAIENAMAPAFAPDGTLLIAYARQALKYDTLVISPTLVITNALQPDYTDLYVLQYTPAIDLSLEQVSLPEYANNPWPGDTVQIQAEIRNASDLAALDLEIALYDGDPLIGGALITTTVISGALPGGELAIVSIPWTVPLTPTQSFELHAVLDPDNLIMEANESNNVGSFLTVVPDVAISSVRAYYYDQHQVVPAVVIVNNGPITATNVLLEMRQESITGTLQYTGLIPMLEPNGMTIITTTWNASTWATGEHEFYAILDSQNAIPEVDKDNNLAVFPVKVQPDLVIYAGDIDAELLPESGGPVTVTVRNWGTAVAENITVTLYEGLNLTPNATALYTWTVPSLAVDSDGDVQLVTTLDHRPNRLFAIADPDNEIEELDESNNIALVTQPISITFRYHDLEQIIPVTATVTISGSWSSEPITLTRNGNVYSATVQTADTTLSYRYVVNDDINLLNTGNRIVTPTVGITYDDYLQVAQGAHLPKLIDKLIAFTELLALKPQS